MLEISAAVSALKSTYEVAKVAVQGRDEAKIQAAVSEIGGKLLDVTLAGVTAAEKVAELAAQLQAMRDELGELKRKQAERDRYTLMEVSEGGYVYYFEPSEGEVTPPHYVCQICFDKGVKSVMQRRAHLWACPEFEGHWVSEISVSEEAKRQADRFRAFGRSLG